MKNLHHAIAWLVVAMGTLGCAEMGNLGGARYGETTGPAVAQADREGSITSVEVVQVDEDFKLGVGTAVGAVAGGLLGSRMGGSGSTAIGAAVGAASGTLAESKLKKRAAQRVVVRMKTGGSLTVVQPVNSRLQSGMPVRVEGSGEAARVVPR